MSSSSSSRNPQAKRAPTSTVQPPQWQAPWHQRADLGYPDFHPPRPGQEEDSMAEAQVKNGYIAKSFVQTDSFTVHEMIYDSWEKQDQTVVRQLGDLMSEVAARRERNVLSIGPHSYRLPERKMVPAKTQAWMANLANPDFPLTELNKVIYSNSGSPKGSELLNMLENNKVTVPRAVWFVRVLGALDTQHTKSRGTKPSQHSVEWAGVVTSNLKKQLAEIVLPRAQTATSSALKSTFKSVLGDTETRGRWVQKWTWTTAFLRELYSESQVDHATFLFWLAQQVGESIIPQLGFIAKLADEYVEDLLKHRGFLRPFITGLVEKLVQIAGIPQAERGVVAQLSQTLGSLLQQTFVGFPDAFVFPRIWKVRTNQQLLHHLLVKGPNEIVQAPPDNRRALEIFEEMRVNFEAVEKRNNALLFTSLPPRNSVAMRLVMADIQLLNSLGPDTQWNSIKFFDSTSHINSGDSLPSTFDNKLNVLLTWAVVRSQYGDHRPFAASTLISLLRDEAKMRAVRRKLPKPDGALQEKLFRWIDASEVARDHHANLEGVALLYAELCRRGLFSYRWFLQRLMARGETGSRDGDAKSHLLTVLEALPLPSALFAMERVTTLYGVEATDVSASPRKLLRQEIKAAIPMLWGDQTPGDPVFPNLVLATRFEQQSIVAHWLLPLTMKFINQTPIVNTEPRLGEQGYATLVELMRLTKTYSSMIDLNLSLLRDSISILETSQITDCFLRHADVWASIDALGTISEMLFETHKRMQLVQVDSHSLLLVISRHFVKHMSGESRKQVELDMQGYTLSVRPPSAQSNTLPPIIQDILDLPQSEDPDIAPSLACSLWMRYSANPQLGSIIWDNVVQGVRSVSRSPDTTLHGAHLQLFTDFLQEMQRFFPFDNTLDVHIQHWFRHGNGREEFSEYDSPTWTTVTLFVLQLVLRGCVTSLTLLENIAYVAWKMAATLDRRVEQTETFLKAANVLTERLLLIEAPAPQSEETEVEGIPPLTLADVQRFQTQRQRVYSGSAIKSLYKALRHLVALEVNTNLSDDVREQSQRIRVAFCQHAEFRTMAFRHLGDLKDVFVRPLITEKDVRLADALRLIIHLESETPKEDSASEPVSQWQAIFSQLNAWGFSRASIELRLTLERMGSGLESNERAAKAKAEADINGFMTGLFSRVLDPEETDLTADVLAGIGGAVAGRFLNHGTKRLSSLLIDLTKTSLDPESVSQFIVTSGEVLRLLVSVLIPPPPAGEWTSEWVPSKFDDNVSEGFFSAISKALGSVEQSVKDRSNPARDVKTQSRRFVELLFLLCRMLHFMLRFDGIWTDRVRNVADGLVTTLINLDVAYGGAIDLNTSLFDILSKTTSYVIDEIPKDAKPDMDLVRQIPGVNPETLPSRIPPEYRETIGHLVAYIPEDAYTANLVQVMESSNLGPNDEAEVQLGHRVQPRPWEWLDYLEEPRHSLPGGADGELQVRNDASIPLETFQARLTGERIPSRDRSVEEEDTKRHMRDRFYAETKYERDWKESRIGTLASTNRPGTAPSGNAADGGQSSEDDEPLQHQQQQQTHARRADQSGMMEDARSSMASNSGLSPAPTRASSSSRRTVEEREIIDVDALPGPEPASTRGRKRKATGGSTSALEGAIEVIDDEIEIIEPNAVAIASRSRRGGKTRPSSGGRGKGKKKA